jgi:hypothetical protein
VSLSTLFLELFSYDEYDEIMLDAETDVNSKQSKVFRAHVNDHPDVIDVQ